LTRYETRLLRFQNLGHYEYAYRRGWLHRLADTSAIYARLREKLSVPTVYAPWGGTTHWYANLGLERDIDVLWMGKHGSRRRSQLLSRICQELRSRGVRLHVADNVENPFIFGDERIQMLNRAKITLNLTRTWYDDNFSRFALAAPNGSLAVSEPLLPHSPEWQPGKHYIASPVKQLAQTIAYYLEHESERQMIAAAAYELVTTTLSFQNSVQRLVAAARERMPAGMLPVSRA
jgi:hypothetical protein